MPEHDARAMTEDAFDPRLGKTQIDDFAGSWNCEGQTVELRGPESAVLNEGQLTFGFPEPVVLSSLTVSGAFTTTVSAEVWRGGDRVFVFTLTEGLESSELLATPVVGDTVVVDLPSDAQVRALAFCALPELEAP